MAFDYSKPHTLVTVVQYTTVKTDVNEFFKQAEKLGWQWTAFNSVDPERDNRRPINGEKYVAALDKLIETAKSWRDDAMDLTELVADDLPYVYELEDLVRAVIEGHDAVPEVEDDD
jgi:hypothetical protein